MRIARYSFMNNAIANSPSKIEEEKFKSNEISNFIENIAVFEKFSSDLQITIARSSSLIFAKQNICQ